jgi:uncharacterized protein YqeY
MNTNLQKIDSDLKESMLSKDSKRVEALRMLKTALEREQKINNKEITDDDFFKVLNSSIKKVKESIASYKMGNRQDLVDKEELQLKVYESYQPEQMSENDLIPYIETVFSENTNAKNSGMLMGIFMKKYPDLKNKFDTQLLKTLIENKFNG